MSARTSLLAVAAHLVVTAALAQSPCGFPPGGEPGWCTRTEAGPDGMSGTADDRPDCVVNAGLAGSAPCTQTQSDRWVFQDGPACNGCRYELFVSVSCGSSLWLDFEDAEGMMLRARLAGSAVDLPLVAENECSVRQGVGNPFIYCDGCSPTGLVIPKDAWYDEPPYTKSAGTCVLEGPFGPLPLPEVPCLPWTQSGTVVWWGRFVIDVDGDGMPDAPAMPPCANCAGPPDCACGDTSSNHRVSDGQHVRVRVALGTPGPQVVRLLIESADADQWVLQANCDGVPSHREYTIHDTCEAASTALGSGAGLPNLSLPDEATGPGLVVTSTAGCPDSMTVEVTVCNSGDTTAFSAPITLIPFDGVSSYTYGDTCICPLDPARGGPIPPGTCRTCPWVVPRDPAVSPPAILQVWVDMLDDVSECADHRRGRDGCAIGPDFATVPWCGAPGPACRAVAACSASPAAICLGDVVSLSAAGSSVAWCGGTVEVQYEDALGNPLPGGAFPAPMTLDWTPPSPGAQQVFVRARCAADPSCTDLSSPTTVSVDVAGPFATAISAVPEGSCAIRLSWTAAASGTYDVYRNDATPVPLDAAHRVASGLVNPAHLDPVPTLDPYFYRVELVTGCGRVANGAGEATAAATPPSFPSPLTVVAEGECALRLTWDAATVAAGTVTYDVYRNDASPVPLDAAHRIATGLAVTTLLDAPPWAAAHVYRVEAVTACGRVANGGGDSAPVSALDLQDPSFAGIENTVDLGYCQVEVSWSDASATDSCSGIAGFNVYRDHGVGHRGETLVASLVPASPHVDTTPGNGTWVYVVRAVDRSGREEQNDVFQQESEGSCTNDFPGDAGLDREDGMDSPNGDGGHFAPVVMRRAHGDGLRVRWKPSVDEGGLYPVTYSVLRGEVATLRAGTYSHELVDEAACGLTAHEYVMTGQDDGGAAYYLVAPVSGDNATFGYDSRGRRLPGAEVCE